VQQLATNTHIAISVATAIKQSAFRGFENVSRENVNQTFHGCQNLYSPGSFSGTGIGTFSNSEGCQRVIEPDLSPLLYKSKPVQGIDRGITTKYCCKYRLMRVDFPNFIFFELEA
jgi:hypothetical protein